MMQKNTLYRATVTQVVSGGVKLRFDGEITARQKTYTCLGVAPSAGSKVCVAPMSGTYVVLNTFGGSGGGGGGVDWTASSGTWSYVSADNPIVVISRPAEDKISVGYCVKFDAGGHTVYGIVVALTSTTITVLCEIDPGTNLALYTPNTANPITAPYYSPVKAYGFPRDPRKWTIALNYTTETVINNPANNTWYNPDSKYLDLPVGLWGVYFSMCVDATRPSSNDLTLYASLSTSSSAESDTDFSAFGVFGVSTNYIRTALNASKNKPLEIASKTRYYPIMKVGRADVTLLYARNSLSSLVVRAVCAYL